MRICPTYGKEFVRDRPLWLFVILVLVYGVLTLLADPLEIERYQNPQTYVAPSLDVNRGELQGPFQIMLPSTAASSFLVFTFYLYWAGTALLPVKGAWRVTFVCLFFGLGGHALSLSHCFRLEEILAQDNMRLIQPAMEGYLQALVLINSVNVVVSMVLLVWWWQRRSMYRYDFGDAEPEQKHDAGRVMIGDHVHQMNRYH